MSSSRRRVDLFDHHDNHIKTQNLHSNLLTNITNHHTQDGAGGGSKLGVMTDSIASSNNTISSQSVLTASRLNNIQNAITQNGLGGGNKLGVMTDAINTNIIASNAKLDTIATNTANINVNVGDVEINVNDLEVLQLATKNTLFTNPNGTGNTIGENASAINANINTANGKLDTIITNTAAASSSGSATEAKQDVQEVTLDAILAKNTEIESLVEIISEFNIDNTDVSVTSLIPGVAATSLGKAIQSAQGATDTGVATLAVRNDALADLAGADHDYAPLQVDSSGALYTRSLATELAVTGTNSILTTIDADTNDIKTSLQLIDNAVDGNYLNVNQNIAGTDVDSNSGNKSAATQRVVIATDDVNLSAIKTSVQLIDNAMHTGVIPSSALNVSVGTSALPSGAATDNFISSMRVREDDANTAGQYLMGVSAVIRQDTLASLVGTSGDNTQMSVDANGALYNISPTADALLTTIDEDTNDIKTSVQLLDDVVGTDGSTGPTKCLSMAGTESGGAIQELLVDAAGHLQIDVLSAPSTAVTNGGTFAVQVDGAALTALQLIDDVVGTDGSTGPGKCLSMAGTESGGAIQELLVDANGHLQIDVLSAPSTAVTGAVTATLSATDNAVIDVIADKNTLATTSELKELLSGVTINSGAQSSQFDTENYEKARFFGETTASVGTDIILMGAATDGGQAYVLGENLRSETIGGVHYIYGPVVENLPKYIRIINKSGSTNYVFTKLFMQLSGGRLAV